ncbi:MAG: DUF554 domain-containing protein [Clostridia bacterium]|nr:DUF554 domain-containing protein [Clostridia bacterium]
MYGIGTLINTAAIVLGGIIGMLFGKLFKEQHRDTLCKTCGIAVLFIGTAGALKGMLSVGADGKISAGGDLLIIGCLAVGALIGELINIEGAFERFGAFLKRKTGNAKDNSFIDGFLNASFTVCIGAMAIVGSINDGIYGDYTILLTKAILDFIIILVMAASMGKGTVFSAIPVFLLQGSVTLLARLLLPIMTESALLNLSVVGNVLIFCVGVNLVWGKKIRVANLLPAVVLAVAAAFLPINFF